LIITLDRPSEALERRLSGKIWRVPREEKTVYVINGEIPKDLLANLAIESSKRTSKTFRLASREYLEETSLVSIGDVEFGGSSIVICAGPCAVEDYQILLETAKAVKGAGARVLRGGAFKPRTSPYSFQGLGREGLEILKKVSREVGMPVVTEVTAAEQVSLVGSYADAFQIGARNMQNFDLLKAVGRTRRPVILKRGPSATIEEWLLSAEYLLLGGNWKVILCERGIRTFETDTRNVLDVAGMALTKTLTHLPIIADPSHATGRRDLIAAASRAAVAAGADGLLIEVHSNPGVAMSDGPQSLTPLEFELAVREIKDVAKAVGRCV
jgi:3-deoxy-7-phosphoheptulonate synthase